MTASFSSEISVKANQQRCADILECKRQIEHWTAKLAALETEQEQQIKLARLRLDASSTWRSLTRKERMEKPFILAALESDELPNMLEDFPNSAFPPLIRLDKEILLARVARSDFHKRYAEERLFVPPRLRGDKEVILQVIPKHPQVIECMSCELRDDEDVFQAVLADNESLPSHFLQHFSERIRADRRLMHQVLSHPMGLSSMAFCSQALRNDKAFVIQAITTGNHRSEPQLLRFISQRLRADREVVLMAVQASGLNLKHASYALRRDAGVVLAASAENGTSFRYCLPGQVKDQLLRDRQFLLEIVKSAPNNVLKNCLSRFRFDRELLLQALENGLDWGHVPETLADSTDFVLKAVEKNPKIFMDLPEERREDFDIAFQAIRAEDVSDDVILEATERCPELLANREAMLAIAKNWWTDVLQETLQFSPLEIRNDKDIIIEAVRNDSIAFEYCSESLQNDRDVVRAAIEASPSTLYAVSEEFQLRNPDLVILAIRKTDRCDLWTTYDDVSELLWHDREVAMAWLSKGGDWLEDDFPEEFCDDEELLLTVAEHVWTDFDYASSSLSSNKQFVLRALARDGRIIRDINEDLRYDFDVAFAAFCKDRRALQFYSGAEDFEFMVSFTERIRKKLEEYKVFNKEIVRRISREDGDDSGTFCFLPMLNQGPDTLQMYKDLLASYLGLPDESELEMLRATSENLLAWGY